MTYDKVLNVIGEYETVLMESLRRTGVPGPYREPLRADTSFFASEQPPGAVRQHLWHMIALMRGEEFAKPEKREKLMRWLGFLQGAMFMLNVYTIDDLKGHNAPPAVPAEVVDGND